MAQTATTLLHPDRLFPAEASARSVARRLYESVRDLPIISPHGHTDAKWFAFDEPFPDPATLFIKPDHYVFRMLYSQGVTMESLGIGEEKIEDPRAVWKIFASHYYLFRGTPTRLWLDYAFEELFGLHDRLTAETADHSYDTIAAALESENFRPRALFDRFHIEVLATTDSALDPLTYHAAIRDSEWKRRVLPTFRPDSVVDPEFDNFHTNVARLGDLTHEDTSSWSGYLAALRSTRQRFKALGCTATDHGHPTARTADLNEPESKTLFAKVLSKAASAEDKELFRAQMLTEFAAMSIEDGLVMQLHPGASRNHNQLVYKQFGRDMGADIPRPTDFVEGLRPLLNRFGNDPNFTLILFRLDETVDSRELAPLAGHYPCLRLGPPWWFFDSPEGMMRFREATTETAGFYNTVGFNDDTRAFLSIPGRHDVARRMDASFLARLMTEHRMEEDEAREVIYDLTNGLVRKAYHL